jgi:hypothetical protein
MKWWFLNFDPLNSQNSTQKMRTLADSTERPFETMTFENSSGNKLSLKLDSNKGINLAHRYFVDFQIDGEWPLNK